MEIVATGAPHPAEPPLPCRGAFATVAVRLRGTFVLRTGTRFFRTIGRVGLTGVMNFNSGVAWLTARRDRRPSAGTRARSRCLLRVSQTRRAADVSGREWLGVTQHRWTGALLQAGYTWYHVMYALGSNPLSGQLPTIAAHLAGPLPIQGSGTFSAQQTSTEMDGACRSTVDDRNVRRHVSRPVRRLGSANC